MSVLLMCLCLTSSFSQSSETTVDQYEMDFDVERNSVRVLARLDFAWEAEEAQELMFYLHKGFTINRVECEGMVESTFESDESFLSAVCKRLTLKVDRPWRGERRPIELEYEGVIPDLFAGDWVESFADCAIVPMTSDLGRSSHFEAKIRFVQPGYRMIGMGTTEKQDDGSWLFRSSVPSGDVPFVASPDLLLSEATRGEINIQVAHTGEGGATMQRLAQATEDILGFYHRSFAEHDPKTEVRYVLRPTDRDLGYARPGYIVLAQGAPSSEPDRVPMKVSRFAFIAHELAHLWWSRGNPSGFENWLNESFAEFSSMLAIGEKYGEAAFLSDVDRKLEVFEGLPPILGLSRTHPQAFLVFYRKGPLLLERLRKKLGTESMLVFLTAMLEEEVATTEDLLMLLEELEGEDRARELRGWLSE